MNAGEVNMIENLDDEDEILCLEGGFEVPLAWIVLELKPMNAR
jgi:hypothetical protein